MKPDTEPAIRPAFVLLLFLAVTCLWFANLDHRVLQHPDEGRYSEISREMVATGDWLTPRLNGLKYFEKPALQYWLTAATFRTFGVHEWTARLWPAAAGWLGVLVIAWAGLRLGGARLALSAGLALAGTLWQIALAQIVTLDSLLGFMLAAGFAAFVVAQRDETPPGARHALMLATWIAFAGATLTKGPIGVVIPGGALVLYTALTRDFAVWRRLHLGTGLLAYFALAAPWFVAVSQANPEFARFFFIHEHVDRFLTTEARRTGSIAYFVPLFVAGMMPWLLVLALNIRRAWREGTPNALGFSWQRFAMAWAAFVFLFFSVSESKLPSYILPMFPPLALVVGWLLLRLDARSLVRATIPVALAAVALAAVAVLGYTAIALHFADERQPIETLLAFGPWLKAAMFSAAVGGLLALACLRSGSERSRYGGIAALSLATLVATQLIVGGLDSFRTTRSTYDILRVAAAATAGPPLTDVRVPFYQVHMYDQTAPFYLRRTTTLVAMRDELALGIDAEPQLAFKDVDALDPGLGRARAGLCAAAPRRLRASRAAGRSDARARARRAAGGGEPAMTWTAFAFLLSGVLLNAAAQLLLKAGTNATGVLSLDAATWATTLVRMATQGYFMLGALCYVISLLVWILGLSRVPVSVAYPLLSIGYVVNAIAAHFLFGEGVNPVRWAGIGFIILGVWLVTRSAT